MKLSAPLKFDQLLALSRLSGWERVREGGFLCQGMNFASPSTAVILQGRLSLATRSLPKVELGIHAGEGAFLPKESTPPASILPLG